MQVTHLASDHLESDGEFFLFGQMDAFPDHNRELGVALRDSADWEDDDEFEREYSLKEFADEMIYCINRLVLDPFKVVNDFVSGFRYLGPLRVTPGRNYRPPRFPDPSRWSSGLGAWDELQNGDEKLVRAVGDWLGDQDKLDSGYRVERKTFKEVDLANPLIRNLLTGRAFDNVLQDAQVKLDDFITETRLVIVPNDSDINLSPHDVGIGISQVVPVLVMALQGQKRLLAIEQPELHLHPKLQAELADLFVEASLGDRRNTIILETHSELIPLRLMRRIRESVDSDGEMCRPPISAKDVSIVYIETHEGATITTPLELGSKGQLLDPWPDGFFEEGFLERFSE